jgi:Zn-dependent protease
VAALLCYFLARSYDSSLLLALSYAGFFLNLFNLIPLSPFDGGRITAVLSPRLWLLGVPILVTLFFMRPSPMLILVGLLAAPQVIKAWKFDPNAPENAAYYTTTAETRLTYGIYYLALTAFLAIMSSEVHDMLGSISAHAN